MLEQIVKGSLLQTATNHCLTVAEQHTSSILGSQCKARVPVQKSKKKALRYFGNIHAPLSTNAKFYLPSSYKLLLQHL